VLNIEQAHY